ncbi:MAG: hypothetical protein LBS19_11825 [Clostridiales bacterium]|jgi:hypothetical protein|nr:hypothetical protein [Clostridiales bacterium]
MNIELLPEREFLVIKGFGRIYDSNVDMSAVTDDSWDIIARQFADGSVERLKKAAYSDVVYMLFCHTCERDDANKCYICSYDIACENTGGGHSEEFGTVRLNLCKYAAYDVDFKSGVALKDAHELADELFWGSGGWLKNSEYICAIDDPANGIGNGYAQIEQYTPFEIGAEKFNMKIWYPLLPKK